MNLSLIKVPRVSHQNKNLILIQHFLFLIHLIKLSLSLEKTSRYKLIELIKECDLNGDGYTGFDEFLYILKRFQDYLTSEELESFVEASQNQTALPELFIEVLEFNLEKENPQRVGDVFSSF